MKIVHCPKAQIYSSNRASINRQCSVPSVCHMKSKYQRSHFNLMVVSCMNNRYCAISYVIIELYSNTLRKLPIF